MKWSIGLASVLGALEAASVQAQVQISLHEDQSNYTYDSPSYAGGGEFRASGSVIYLNPDLNGYSPATAGSDYFQTFCLESSESFDPDVLYNATISDRAMYGGMAPNGDPISICTAWLYSQFAAGTLTGYWYDYSGLRKGYAGALQRAIWWLEGESGGARSGLIDQAEMALYGASGGIYDTAIQGDANGAYNVVAVNLWSVDTGAPAQDQLMVIPEPGWAGYWALCVFLGGMARAKRGVGRA